MLKASLRSYVQQKNDNSSVIRQKGESQNGCFKKTKHENKTNFPKKKHFLPPDTQRNKSILHE